MNGQKTIHEILESHFGNALDFEQHLAEPVLRQMPYAPAVFALAGADPKAQPYIGRTPNLRGRLGRLLVPSERHPRRLHLATLVRTIHWQPVGSDFEALALQFQLLEALYGEDSLARMHLRQPAFVRFHGGNRFPRLSVTHRPPGRDPQWNFGPFASRSAAERYVEELDKFFALRRCIEELEPSSAHPGCVYSEMKMCLAPCNKSIQEADYGAVATSAEAFLRTRGASKIKALTEQRDAASAALEFEQAALLHAQLQRVEGIRSLAPELAQAMDGLTALVLQPSAEPESVALFLFSAGCLRGPIHYSTVGMRIQNENSGSSSLFSHPVALEPVPEEAAHVEPVRLAKGVLEERLTAVLARLAEAQSNHSPALQHGSLALLKRWYYRPEVKRVGEVFFPEEDGSWPAKAILRGIGRVAARQIFGAGREE